MDVSPNALRKEVVKNLREIETYLDRAPDVHVVAPLLLAKATCFNTLALLQEKKK